MLSGNNLLVTDGAPVVDNVSTIEVPVVQLSAVPLTVADATSSFVVSAAGGGDYCASVQNVDINGDGYVTAVDVLIIVNDINSRGGSFHLNAMSGQWKDLADPNGDGWRTPQDALYVIWDLNWNGPHKVVYDCVDLVKMEHNKLGDITVAPGATKVLVDSVTVTSLTETTFPKSFEITGDSNFYLLEVGGKFVGAAGWGSDTIGVWNVALDKNVPVTFDLYVNIPYDVGQHKYTLGSLKVDTFPGATAEVIELNVNDRTVYIQQPILSVPTVVGPNSPITTKQNVLLANLQFTGKESPSFNSAWFGSRLVGGNLTYDMNVMLSHVYLQLPNGTRINPTIEETVWKEYEAYPNLSFLYFDRFDNLPTAKAGEIWQLCVDEIIGGDQLSGVNFSFNYGNYATPTQSSSSSTWPVNILAVGGLG
jgi:hypothetical protein